MKIANLWSGRRTAVLFRTVLFLGILGVSLNIFLFYGATAQAALPTSGSISSTTTMPVTWVGTLTGVPPAANGEPSCDNTAANQNCDTYMLT
ncbi:MAG: hypothetical protein H0U50_12700, partial [Pyrinomonadaceae bacterium]|nr:hypothetical protein [Pyrinomonadaceae bacterium]